MDFPLKLISLKQVSCINLIFYIIKTVIITIGDNAMAHLFKFTQIILQFLLPKKVIPFSRVGS